MRIKKICRILIKHCKKKSNIIKTPEYEQQLEELQQTIEIPESTLQNIANTISKHY